MEDLKKGFYKHFKGGLYKVIGIANHSENLEKMVIYEAQYDSKDFGQKALWARPLNNFQEEVEFEGKKVKRYTYVGETI